MEHCPAKLNTSGQLYPESMTDMKSRFWQISNQSLPRTEVICPQPRHATRVSFFIDSVNRFGPKPKGALPMYRGDCGLEILDSNRSMDDSEWDLEGGGQTSFFCGSPPVRTNNPIVHDAQFAKQTHSVASPLGGSLGMKPRGDRGSPSCGSSFTGSPKVRIEGFSCGKVPAFA